MWFFKGLGASSSSKIIYIPHNFTSILNITFLKRFFFLPPLPSYFFLLVFALLENSDAGFTFSFSC